MFAPLNTTIFIANADGTHERMVVPDAMFDSNPSFSPDGQCGLFRQGGTGRSASIASRSMVRTWSGCFTRGARHVTSELERAVE
jgi:hypothetical protein